MKSKNLLLAVLALSVAIFASPIDAATRKTAKSSKSTTLTKKSSKKKRKAKTRSLKKSTKKSRAFKRSSQPVPAKEEIVGKTTEGKPVFEGERHGHYYLDGDKKVYVKNFVGAKIVGKTADGREIYEGPRGGRFYYTASGNKEYVKKYTLS